MSEENKDREKSKQDTNNTQSPSVEVISATAEDPSNPSQDSESLSITESHPDQDLSDSTASTIPKEPQFNAGPVPRLNKPNKSRNSTGKGWNRLLLVMLILAVIGIGWSSWQQYQLKQQWQNLSTELNQQASQQNSQVSLAREDAQQSLSQNQNLQLGQLQQQQKIDQLTAALTATQERVKELSGRQAQDWLLAEAEYLIKLSEYKITLEKDKTTAIGLLKVADEKIMQIADNSLLELRQAVANDIGHLQLLQTPDVGGISSQIYAISQQIESLTLKHLEFDKLNEQITDADQTEQAEQSLSWKMTFRELIDEFVTIRTDNGEPIKPLMKPEHRGNLNTNIQLALQKAQIATLRQDQALYLSSLQEAKDWIAAYFSLNQQSQTLLQNIDELLQMRVSMDFPRALQSKASIQAINQTRLYQWLENSQTATLPEQVN